MLSSTFADGSKIPVVGLGTWQSAPGEVGKAVKSALEIGYRYFDLAYAYQNQKEIGLAFKEAFDSGKYKREDIFVTSKLNSPHHHQADVIPELKETLSDLQFTYLDLYIIHNPLCFVNNEGPFPKNLDGTVKLDPNPAPVIETWREMEKAKELGLVKHIGVSNFNVQLLNDLYAAAKIKPEDNQIELHPYLQQSRIIEFCKKKGIHVTGFSPLALGGQFGFMKQNVSKHPLGEIKPFQDPILTKIAAKHKKTIAQVMIRWGFQRSSNLSVIPKSVQESRIKENFDVFNFELDADDLADIAKIDRNQHILDLEKLFGVPLFD